LFGLGFDTATEVAILAIAVSASTKHVPALAIISLPIIFAAGMSLMDTVDAVFMSRVYHWAFANPVRKTYYNLVITGLSVFVALAIGSIELLQVVSEKLSLTRGLWHSLNQLNFGVIGLCIVFMFIITWLSTVLMWRKRFTTKNWQRSALDSYPS
jgi:high-affinity nickel-transport protein